MNSQYYFVSDLHLGGDAGLDACDYEEELISFLRSLEEAGTTTRIELILVGDTFGFWELTGFEGPDMVDHIVSQHEELFEQFRSTGRAITITLIPGNHDHDLACYPQFKEKLAAYNMHLDPSQAITREINGQVVWIEHGNQHDTINRVEPWSDPYVRPIGYHITEHIVRTAGQRSRLGRHDWLRDIESVSPSENVPNWLLSNYFYREMNPFLRLIAAPFLLFSGLSLLVLLGTLFENFGLLPAGLLTERLLYRPPYIGEALRYFVTINLSALAVVLLVGIPLRVVVQDFRRALDRYGLTFTRKDRQAKDERYREAARTVFEAHPEVTAFVYGHTHFSSLVVEDDRAIINTGTWLKRLARLRSRYTLLPDIYYPYFRIGYFRLKAAEDGGVAIEYEQIPKHPEPELSLLQKVITYGRTTHLEPRIEKRTVIGGRRSKLNRDS